jgi:hypothetical protein
MIKMSPSPHIQCMTMSDASASQHRSVLAGGDGCLKVMKAVALPCRCGSVVLWRAYLAASSTAAPGVASAAFRHVWMRALSVSPRLFAVLRLQFRS